MHNFWGMRPARSPAELGLTADDRRKLEWALRQTRDARHFRRLLAITLIAEGKGPGEAAHLAAAGPLATGSPLQGRLPRRGLLAARLVGEFL